MRMICESEHVRNLASFDVLIAKIMALGKYYNPTKGGIQLEALGIVSQNAKVAIANVHALTNQHIYTVNVREEAFNSLKLLNKQLYNELRLTTNINETEIYMLVGSGKIMYNQFASQQRYDFLLDNFCKIIKLLKADLLCLPDRTELKLNKLEEFYAVLCLKNNEVKRTNALLSNACLIRNEVMYREVNGLVALSAAAKMYIKYHFGWESTQFKQVAKLMIKKAKP